MSYSDKETAAVRAAAPLTYDSAAALAETLGKSTRSVIAKAKSLDLEYTPKAKPAPKGKGVTKADLVAKVASELGLPAEMLEGLKGATVASLEVLLTKVS